MKNSGYSPVPVEQYDAYSRPRRVSTGCQHQLGCKCEPPYHLRPSSEIERKREYLYRMGAVELNRRIEFLVSSIGVVERQRDELKARLATFERAESNVPDPVGD